MHLKRGLLSTSHTQRAFLVGLSIGILVIVSQKFALLPVSKVYAVPGTINVDLSTGGGLQTTFGGLGSQQNLLKYSQDFANAVWTNVSGTFTKSAADADTAPDGSTSAEDVIGLTGSPAKIGQALASGDYHSQYAIFSVSAKADSNYTGTLNISVAGGGTYSQNISLTSTWKRFAISQQLAAGDTGLVTVSIGIGSSPYVKTYLWGAQLQMSSSSTVTLAPYVATSANPFTSNASNAGFNTVGNLLVGGYVGVGPGAPNPIYPLQVNNASNLGLRLEYSATNYGHIYKDNNTTLGGLVFKVTGGTSNDLDFNPDSNRILFNYPNDNGDVTFSSYNTARNYKFTPEVSTTGQNPSISLYGYSSETGQTGAKSLTLQMADGGSGAQPYGSITTSRGHLSLAPSSGLVGIGTTAPGATLDVKGTINGSLNNVAGDPDNMIRDGNFEFANVSTTVSDNWTSGYEKTGTGESYSRDCATAANIYEGGCSQAITITTGGTSIASDVFTVEPGITYSAAVRVLGNFGSGFYFRICYFGAIGTTNKADCTSTDIYANAATTASWAKYSGTFTVPTGNACTGSTVPCTRARVVLYSWSSGAGTRYFDSVVVRRPVDTLSLTGGNFTATPSGSIPLLASVALATATASGTQASTGKYLFTTNAQTNGPVLRAYDITVPSSPALISSYPITQAAQKIVLSGKYAYLAEGGQGVQIIDVSNAKTPVGVGVIPGNGQGMVDISISGKYMLVANQGANAILYDISNPTKPLSVATIGNIYTQGAYIQGDYAYTCGSTTAIQVVDISNPSSPSIIGSYALAGQDVRGCTVSGKYAYVGNAGNNGQDLYIIDLADPANPALTSSIDVTAYGAYKLKIVGKTVYLTSVNGIYAVDVTNPAMTGLIGTYIVPGGGALGQDIEISGKYAYVQYNTGYVLAVLDLNGFDIPTLRTGTAEISKLNVLDNADIFNNLYVHNGITVGNGGISVASGEVSVDTNTSTTAFEVTQRGSGAPANIQGFTATSGTTLTTPNLQVERRDAATPINNIETALGLYTGRADMNKATESARLSAVMTDVNARTADLAFSTLNAGTLAEKLRIDAGGNVGIGTTAPSARFTLTGGNMLQKLTSMSIMSTTTTPSATACVAVSGKYAYVCNEYITGVSIYDISTPSSPVFISSFSSGANGTYTPYGITVSGRYLYLAQDQSVGLRIFDISNPTTPVLVGSYNTPGTAYSVKVQGRYAYIADGTSLQIVDVSNPTAPTSVSSYAASVSIGSVDVQGRYAYVSDDTAGLKIIDISNPASPVLAGSVDPNVSGSNRNALISDGYAYIGHDSLGLSIIKLDKFATPTIVGTYGTTVYPIAISGNYLIADGPSNSVIAIDISNPASPTLAASVTLAAATGGTVSGKYAYVSSGSQNKFYIIDLNGVTVPGLNAGRIMTDNINVTGDIDVYNNAYVHSGLTVGAGLSVSGDVVATGSALLGLMGGNVGIGTTSPVGALQIANSGTQWSGDNVGKNLILKDAGTARNTGIGIFDANNANPWAIINNAGTLRFATMPAITDSSTTPSYRMLIDTGGNVGIGTTAPLQKLTVGTTTGNAIHIGQSDPTTGAWLRNDGSNMVISTLTGGIYFGYAGTTNQAHHFYYGGSNEYMTQPGNGNVGIGSVTPAAKFDVSGTVKFASLTTGNTTNFLCLDTTTFLVKNSSGSCSVSDIRIKQDITSIHDSLDVLSSLDKLRGVYYYYDQQSPYVKNLPKTRQVGLIAQEVEKVLPELVEHDKDSVGLAHLDYAKFPAYLLEVAKAQQTELSALKQNLTNLNLTSDGNLAISVETNKNTTVTNTSTNTVLQQIAALAKLVVGTIQAGIIETQKLIVGGVDILKKLTDLQAKVDAQQKQIDELQNQINQLKSHTYGSQ